MTDAGSAPLLTIAGQIALGALPQAVVADSTTAVWVLEAVRIKRYVADIGTGELSLNDDRPVPMSQLKSLAVRADGTVVIVGILGVKIYDPEAGTFVDFTDMKDCVGVAASPDDWLAITNGSVIRIYDNFLVYRYQIAVNSCVSIDWDAFGVLHALCGDTVFAFEDGVEIDQYGSGDLSQTKAVTCDWIGNSFILDRAKYISVYSEREFARRLWLGTSALDCSAIDDSLFVIDATKLYFCLVDYQARGPIGEQGPQGPQGPEGPVQGVVGPTGPQGVTGPQSTVTGPGGPTGPTGPLGVAGVQGPQGPQGAMGLQGLPGPTGIQGEQGNAGPAGPAGAIGPLALNFQGSWNGSVTYQASDAVYWQGSTYKVIAPTVIGIEPGVNSDWQTYYLIVALGGLQGPEGSLGPTGPQGSAGATGEIGPMGELGPTGPTAAITITEDGEYVATSDTLNFQSGQGVVMSNDGGVLRVSLPAGIQGPAGPQGPVGAGIVLVGKVWENEDLNLEYEGSANDTYLEESTGHAWTWDGMEWIDVGLIQGPEGPQGPPGEGTGSLSAIEVSGGEDELAGEGARINFKAGEGVTVMSSPDKVDIVISTIGAEISGYIGPTGPTGPAGYQGIDGGTGPTGPYGGPPGPTGPEGPTGIQGPTGYGVQGPVGGAGPQGPQGPLGPTGPQGIQGQAGIQGSAGPEGAIGPVGAQGPQGPQGPEGLIGVQGVTGPTGMQGAASTVTGPTGPLGSTGPVGVTGAAGPTGPQGPSGTIGAGTANQIIYKNASNVLAGTSALTFFDSTNDLVVESTSQTPGMHLRSVQGAGIFPAQIQMYRSGASNAVTPNNSQIGEIRFDGVNSTPATTTFGTINLDVGTVNATAAPSSLLFRVHNGSSLLTRLKIEGSGDITGARRWYTDAGLFSGERTGMLWGTDGSWGHLTADNSQTNGMRMSWNASGPMVFGTNTTAAYDAQTFTERVRISAAGFMGIGDASPSVPLEFGDSLGTKIAFAGGASLGVSQYAIGIETDEFRVATSGDLTIRTGGYSGTERLRMLANGTLRVSGLSGTGIRLVVADDSGNLSTQPTPTQEQILSPFLLTGV